MQVDLHTHTTASDGELSPGDLLALQMDCGIELTAFTDHDCLDGWDQIASAPLRLRGGPRLVPGIEISTVWMKTEIHVLGLQFDPAHRSIREAVDTQRLRRAERAERIADRLDRLGIRGALEGARRHAGEALPGRPHFARHLVDTGRVRSTEEAFRRYFAHGKPAAVSLAWAPMEQAVAWIREAGGVAVLAHPLAYRCTRSRLRRLLVEFRDAGGVGLEVAMPGLNRDQMRSLAQFARETGYLGSSGSDFHSPGQPWRTPSQIPPLPEGLRPVWADWV